MIKKVGSYYLTGSGLMNESVSASNEANFNAYVYINAIQEMVSSYLYMRSAIKNHGDNEDRLADTLSSKLSLIETILKKIIIDYIYICDDKYQRITDKLDSIKDIMFLNKKSIESNKEGDIYIEDFLFPISDRDNFNFYTILDSLNIFDGLTKKSLSRDIRIDDIIDDEIMRPSMFEGSNNKVIGFFEDFLECRTISDIYAIEKTRCNINNMIAISRDFKKVTMMKKDTSPMFSNFLYKDLELLVDKILLTLKNIKSCFLDLVFDMESENGSLTDTDILNKLGVLIEIFGAYIFYTTYISIKMVSDMNNYINRTDALTTRIEELNSKYRR